MDRIEFASWTVIRIEPPGKQRLSSDGSRLLVVPGSDGGIDQGGVFKVGNNLFFIPDTDVPGPGYWYPEFGVTHGVYGTAKIHPAGGDGSGVNGDHTLAPFDDVSIGKEGAAYANSQKGVFLGAVQDRENELEPV
uniref:Uncharacterized protein n=1 Tax=Candidatus Kentrum sp. TC TaxID=2126339 RepID=A0A450YXZ6_9GAMM|nr:MAG: hypothetical protein BECKTC1821E_GA0114239_106311 [Candidatus Kentron sp. TC]